MFTANSIIGLAKGDEMHMRVNVYYFIIVNMSYTILFHSNHSDQLIISEDHFTPLVLFLQDNNIYVFKCKNCFGNGRSLNKASIISGDRANANCQQYWIDRI
jgi:hypothetical protein